MIRSLLLPLVLGWLLAIFVSTAHAQMRPMLPPPVDTVAPTIWLMSGAGDVYVSTPYVEIEFCDRYSLNASSRWMKLNGQVVTESFSYLAGEGSECEWISNAVSSTSSLTLSMGQNTLQAHICDNANNCTTESWTITRRAGPLPYMSLEPHSANLQDYGRCAMDCFAATYAQSTVPYYTLDSPRNVTLVYNGDRVDPKPFVHVNVNLTPGNLPTYFTLKIRKADANLITFLNGETELHFAPSAGAALRVGGQFNATANVMGNTAVYPVTVIVGAVYIGGVEEVAAATRVIVVNETNSPIARGWTVAGIQQLYVQADSSILITEGDGSATYFLKSGSTFVSPAGDFSRVQVGGCHGQGAPWSRQYADSSCVRFNSGGMQYEIRDRFGNNTTFVHAGVGQPSVIYDPTNSQFNQVQITFSYGANGLSGIQDAFGRTTDVTVQSNHTLTAITDPDNVSTTLGYDASLRLSSITDRAGATTTLAYQGGSDKLATVTQPAVPIFGEGTVSPVTTLAAWQLVGVPTDSTSTPFGAPRADTVRATVTDPGSHASRFTVNAFGQPLQTTGPLGDTVAVWYTPTGQPGSVADRLGIPSSFVYDAAGRQIQSTSAGLVTTYRYLTAWPTPDTIIRPGQPVLRQFVNVSTGLVDSVNGGSGRIRYSYDSRGRLWKTVDNMFHLVQRTWYDGTNGNRWKDSMPGGRVTTYGYDGIGRLATVASPGVPTRTLSHDVVNRVVATADGVNPNATIYGWDSLRLRTVRDPKLQTYGFSYNALGWITARTDPLGRSTTVQYDRDGLARRTTNRRGQNVDLTYDALHRSLVRSGTNLSPDTFSYSGDGRRLTASNADARDTTWLNARLQPDSLRTVLTVPGGSSRAFTRRFAYRMDALVDTIGLSSPGLSFLSRRHAYSSSGRLDSLRLGPSSWTRFTYDGDGLPTVTYFPGTDSIARGRIEPHDVYAIESPVLADSVHFDSLGRVDRIRSGDGVMQRVFTYDGLGRFKTYRYQDLATVDCFLEPSRGLYCDGRDLFSTTHWYDPVGNRDSSTGSQGTLRGVYGPGNRISSFGSCSYTTDDDGNVTSRTCPQGSATLTWAADGRLTSVTGSGITATFAYDAEGRLVRRDVGGSPASWFLWAGDDLAAELTSGAATVVAQYDYYGTDSPHAVIVGGTPYYAHTDAQGNVRGRTIQGSVYASYSYDEWGAGSGFDGANRALWKGALYMEPEAYLDLYYMRNRWYEPYSGRFLSEDPLGGAGGANPYAFASDDPVNGADPSGAWNFCPARSAWSKEGGCVQVIGGVTFTVPPIGRSDYDVRNQCPPEMMTERDGCKSQEFYVMSGGDVTYDPPPLQLTAALPSHSCWGQAAKLGLAIAIDGLTFGLGKYAVKAGRVLLSARNSMRVAQHLGDLGWAQSYYAAATSAAQRGATALRQRGLVQLSAATGTVSVAGEEGSLLSLHTAAELVPLPWAGSAVAAFDLGACLLGR
jgi:RHS repeat-associated protein